jgi:hypothetical protein
MSLATNGVAENTWESALDSLPKLAALPLAVVFAPDLISGLA